MFFVEKRETEKDFNRATARLKSVRLTEKLAHHYIASPALEFQWHIWNYRNAGHWFISHFSCSFDDVHHISVMNNTIKATNKLSPCLSADHLYMYICVFVRF